MKPVDQSEARAPGAPPFTRLDAAAIGAYILVALLVMSPVLFRLSTAVFGSLSDAKYYIWLSWWRRYSLQHGLNYLSQPIMQAPFGAQQVVPGFSGLVWSLTGLSALFGEVAAYNLMILFSLILAGCFTYFVFRQFLGSRPIAFLAGLAFAYSPIALDSASNHVDVAQHWVIPAFVLALIAARRRQNVGAAIGLGLAFALASYFNPYLAYAVVIAALTFAVFDTLYLIRQEGWRAAFARRRWLTYGGAALVGLLAYAPELVAVLRATLVQPDNPLQMFNKLQQPIFWFYTGSIRPWDLFLPSTHHPIFGDTINAFRRWLESLPRIDFTSPALDRRVELDRNWYWASSITGRHALYLGYAVMAMAVLALRAWKKGSLPLLNRPDVPADRRFWLRYFLILFVVIFLFMQPPFLPLGAVLRPIWEPLGSILIPTPTLFTMTYLSPLRGVIRIFPMALLSVLFFAALGLEWLVEGRSRAFRVGALAAFTLITGIEYLALPGASVLPSLNHARWLADQPPGSIVAYYPADNLPLAQPIHEQPVVSIINRPATPIDSLTYVENLALHPLDAETVSRLAALGTQYVVVQPPDAAVPAGLELAETFDDATIYRITAPAVPLLVTTDYDLKPWTSTADWSWLSGEKEIVVWNTLPDAVEITLTLDLPADFAGGQVEVTRQLTPHPDTLILYGAETDNPFAVAGYDQPTRTITVDSDGHLAEPVVVRPGETVLTLRWVGPETPVRRITLPLPTD
jgi:hypothetical protein